jgi:anti-sigma regulatory factor (Ser/Thr protein kinase)
VEDLTAAPLPDLEGPSVAVDLPLSPQASRLARLAVRSALARWDVDDDAVRYDVLLVVSELVTNALRHGGGDDLQLELRLDDRHVTVAVRDSSPAVPSPRSPEDDDETGRGLAIVDGVTADWGVEDSGAGGKRVWARVNAQVRR